MKVSKRPPTEKQCHRCKKVKPLEAFCLDRTKGKYARHYICRVCRSIQDKEYKLGLREPDYYEDNPLITGKDLISH